MATIQYVGDGGPDGTMFGKAATYKLGFYGATPIVQPAAIADATDATTVIAKCNLIITALEGLGLIATV